MADINKAEIANEFKAFKCPTCGCVFIKASRCPACGQRVMSGEEFATRMKDRVQMVRAMETIARSINDEEVLLGWLMGGVADGDIDNKTTDEAIVDMYCKDDETFIGLMDCFLRCMKRAYTSGGLYAGNVVSTIGDEEE